MKTFKEYYNNRPVLYTIEDIDIKDVGVLKGKIDSGNEAYNVLHGVNLRYENGNVLFNTVNDVQISKPVEDKINIHIGSGVKEERPVVKFDISLHDKDYFDIPFTIADRTENTEPILIGEPFIKSINALIDVNSKS
jgi:hypothetical protein